MKRRYPWGSEAMQKAKAENKPIFLSVGYSTCHWCHVMERESFESQEIAEVLNKFFVSIKVDREERPDVDRVYMTFVQVRGLCGCEHCIVFIMVSKYDCRLLILVSEINFRSRQFFFFFLIGSW